MNAVKMRCGVSTASTRPNAYTTNATGIVKLPSRMIVGTRLALPVAKVVITVATQSGGGQITPVDTVGAGDAFVAGYLAERLAGAKAEQRLQTAIAMGAYAVTVPGDCEGLPTRAELGALSIGDINR